MKKEHAPREQIHGTYTPPILPTAPDEQCGTCKYLGNQTNDKPWAICKRRSGRIDQLRKPSSDACELWAMK